MQLGSVLKQIIEDKKKLVENLRIRSTFKN